MKRSFISIIILLGIIIASCEDPKREPNLKPEDDRNPPSLTNVEDVYVFTEDNNNDTINITWSAADIGPTVQVSYILQLDVEGSDFSNPLVLAETNATNAKITNQEFNKQVLTLGIQAGNATTVVMRVLAKINSLEDMPSSAENTSVTAWNDPFAFPDKLFLVGPFNGWNNNNDKTIVRPIPDQIGEYNGLYILESSNDEALKIIARGGDWDSQWGDNEPDNILDPKADGDPKAINIAAKGYFTVYINWATKEYELTPQTWGVIGSATPGGWDNDTDMTYDGTDKFTIDVDMVPGEWKFRLANDWAVNLGDDGGGGLSQDGGNFSLSTAGNYTVELTLVDIKDGNATTYSYTITSN